MLRLISVSVICAILCSFNPALASGFQDSYFWPLKTKKQFSSGFGDARPGRFHMGMDLRTGGQEGVMVFCPEDGYVWRIKSSYTGYGKALYIKGNSGRIYVFGHLQKYNWDIGTYLQEKQIESGRYFQDLNLTPDVLPVKRGEHIARTGQTGAGAPHLHFEVRRGDSPTHPLLYQVGYRDQTPPKIEAIWFEYMDEKSLFDSGGREIKLVPNRIRGGKRFTIADTIVVTGRFNIKAAITDVATTGSFLLGPSEISLFIDDQLYHRIVFDRLEFDENRFVLLDRDYDPAKKNFKRVYNLYRKAGNKLSKYEFDASLAHNDGTFSDSQSGYHHLRIETGDPAGNSSRLEMVFFYNPGSGYVKPLNRSEISDSLFVFDLEPGFQEAVDSVALLVMGEGGVGVGLFPDIIVTENQLRLAGDFSHRSNYRMVLYKDKQQLEAVCFSTMREFPNGREAIDSAHFSIMDQGILISCQSSSPSINWLVAEIRNDVESVRRYFKKISSNQFSLYYEPEGDVGKIESVIIRGPVGYRPDSLTIDVSKVNAGGDWTIGLRPGLTLSWESDDLFDDALLFSSDTIIDAPQSGYYLYGPLILGPENYSFAGWAELQAEIDPNHFDPSHVGLYVHHPDKGWLWAGGEYDVAAGIMKSKLGGAGVIAMIADTAGPVIKSLNIKNNATIKMNRPVIRCVIDDELSGFENDLNFNITIDGKWMVPEFDPERKRLVCKPHWKLSKGSHQLVIEATDRCGNKSRVSRKFRVGRGTGR